MAWGRELPVARPGRFGMVGCRTPSTRRRSFEQRELRLGVVVAGSDSRSPGRAAAPVAEHCAAVLAGVGIVVGLGVAPAGAQFRRPWSGRDDTPARVAPPAAAVLDAGHQRAQRDAREAGGFDLVAHPAAVSGAGVGLGPFDHRPGPPRREDTAVVEGGHPGRPFIAGAGSPAAAARGRPDPSSVRRCLGEVRPPGEVHHTGVAVSGFCPDWAARARAAPVAPFVGRGNGALSAAAGADDGVAAHAATPVSSNRPAPRRMSRAQPMVASAVALTASTSPADHDATYGKE
jgi:hypothetical protein